VNLLTLKLELSLSNNGDSSLFATAQGTHKSGKKCSYKNATIDLSLA